MPSRKSPSQRGLEGRLARLVSSMIPGTHGGRVLNASPVSATSVSASVPAVATSSGTDDHDGAGVQSTAVGTSAAANGRFSTALGDVATVDAGTDDGTALGSFSAVRADEGTAVGTSSSVTGFGGTAVGVGASVSADNSTAIGYGAHASLTNAVALGYSANAGATDSVAIGKSAATSSARSIAIGKSATVSTVDRCVIKANELQLDQSSGTGQTSLILRDSTNVRWRVTVSTGGALVVALA